MIDYLLNFINCISYFLFFYVFFENTKFKKITLIGMLFLESVVCYFLSRYIITCYSVGYLVSDLLLLIIIISLLEWMFNDGKEQTKISIPILVVFLNFISLIITTVITFLFLPIISGEVWNDVVASLYHIVCLFVFYLLAKFMHGKIQAVNMSLMDDFLLTLLFPTLLQYCIYEMYFHQKTIELFILMVLSLLLNVTMMMNLYKKMKDNEDRLQNEFIQTKLDSAEKQFQAIIENEETIRKIRHDLKNHMMIIRSLNEDGKQKELDEYLNQIIPMLKKQKTNVYCDNMYLNIVLNDKISQYKQIYFDILISKNFCSHFHDMDLSVLISNLLDNAIQELMIHSNLEQRIELKMYEKGNFQMVVIKNPLSTHKDLVTEKIDQQAHGFGYKIIQGIVDKYDGEMLIEQDEYFTVTLMFCINAI